MKIVIFGCGRMGSGIATTLIHSGHQITVVDNDPQSFDRLGAGFSGQIIRGDALEEESFIRSGVGRVDGFAAVTGSDMVNTVVARVARQIYRVPKVVARIHDPLHAEVYRRLGIQTVTNVDLGIVRISELLTFSDLEIIHTLGSGEVGIVTLEIPPILEGRPVSDLSVPGEIKIISLTRSGKTFIPMQGTVFQKEDMVHIAVEESSVTRLKSFLRDA